MNKTKEIYLAGGCFWGTEHYFKQIEGVVETEVGFANGNTENPTYKEVYTDTTGYAETVYVKYDPDVVSLEFLLQMFFKAIDPTSLNKQGHDEGTRYRTGIYFSDSEDLPVIEKVFAEEQKNYQEPLAVEKLPLKIFYTAEEYHQDYLDKNPTGYCHLPQSLFEFARKAKKQILFLFTALLVLSCGSKTGKVASDTDSLTVDSVVEGVVDGAVVVEGSQLHHRSILITLSILNNPNKHMAVEFQHFAGEVVVAVHDDVALVVAILLVPKTQVFPLEVEKKLQIVV